MDAGIALILGVFTIAVVFRLLAGTFDKDRVRRYVESRGGSLNSIEWNPMGRGWFGERSDRIYEVRYTDADGNRRGATCKTSLWSGVYMTEDRVVQPGPARGDGGSEVERLRAENARLRLDIERLRE